MVVGMTFEGTGAAFGHLKKWTCTLHSGHRAHPLASRTDSDIGAILLPCQDDQFCWFHFHVKNLKNIFHSWESGWVTWGKRSRKTHGLYRTDKSRHTHTEMRHDTRDGERHTCPMFNTFDGKCRSLAQEVCSLGGHGRVGHSGGLIAKGAGIFAVIRGCGCCILCWFAKWHWVLVNGPQRWILSVQAFSWADSVSVGGLSWALGCCRW
ncbi:uncharacterized protein LACBIDRAFT_332198 [Laccaria bicolor S238N-H82]|uniref:Predicted protein n=1 Tax=Laccaria bicolor (strain S238N-H82 / ATCC MYA-4686) TaxID=486041 RepID=B0DRX5_LACBS|nr:uncharacterized protein LACBIDRAFT_332198 [Laccaria bicolor S238N-H82]EDR02601.1 predicted protein [Laccaria bicolor S238N-H82]|eukprot:XP_001886645.1 predicted protein [Laccaria bicolor S238N-H82]